jgi:hypothetical protein
MNERIKELAEQCRGNPMTSEFEPRFDKEKFAELIMDECFGVLRKRFMGDWNREDQEVLRCIEDIQKHFGVEE